MRARSAIVALACCGATGSASAADTWIEARTPHFMVVSNAGEGTARKTAGEFEQVRAAYAKIWPWAQLAQGRPTVVLALKNEGTLRRWAPAYFEVKGGIDVVSGSAYGPDRVYLLLRTDWRPASMYVTPNYNLYRAYVGLLLSNSFERRLPLWLSNGLAEVLGNTSVHDEEILIGRPVAWEFERFNRRARLPLRTILDARHDAPFMEKEGQREYFDGYCYLLVHYLLFGDRGAHSAGLTRFQQLWQAGRSQDQALAEAFGDLTALEAQLPLYATSQILGYSRMPLEAKLEGEQPATRVLPPAEVAGLQAAVHVAMRRPVEAQAAIREARTADPRSPVSYDAEGLLADLDRDVPRATQVYAQAVELGSTNAHSHYRAAQLAWKAQLDAPALQAIRGRLERAIELSAANADAHSYLAEVLAQLGDGQRALTSARQAIALEPGVSYHRVALARVLSTLGRDDEAKESAERGLQLADDDAERSNAERALLFVREKARYAEARARSEASARQTSCWAGDATACAQVLPDLEHACGADDAAACQFLGGLYAHGGGVPKDAGKAAGYLQRACLAGDKRACVAHASALARGEGLPKDEPKALAALQDLCDGAFLPACTRLALILVSRPTTAGHARAKALLTRACSGGEQDACSMAGRLK